MTKRHYERIARVIALRYAEAEAISDATRVALVAGIATDLAAIMAADNPRFDRARFLAACGIA